MVIEYKKASHLTQANQDTSTNLIFSFDLRLHCLLPVGLLSHAGLVSLSRFIGTGLMIVFGALCIRGMIYRDIVVAVDHDNWDFLIFFPGWGMGWLLDQYLCS